MSDKMIKVSVILPVYGVEKYIEKCTESLLCQTLDELVSTKKPPHSVRRQEND